mgnify:CR=1 FL=1
MGKIRVSIYIDEDLWGEFKRYAAEKGLSASELLEELIKEELMIGFNSLIPEDEDYLEPNFDPIRPRGLVSGFVREMRDERDGNLL